MLKKFKPKIPVLESVIPIIPNLKYVSIDNKKINEKAKEFAESYAEGKIKLPKYEEETYGKDEIDLEFIFLFNTINFAYTDFDTKEKFEVFYENKKYKGAIALAACMRRAVIEDEIDIFNPDFLEGLSKSRLREITSGSIEIPMLDERLKILNETGKSLRKYGSFRNLCEEAKFKTFNKGKGIVERLVQDFPSFDDISMFDGDEIKFYKRAQLAVIMSYGRFQNNREFFPVKDKEIGKLTVAADYVLPKSLRALGILNYEKSLEEKVDNQIPLIHDSHEEIEIRAATVYASNLLKNQVNEILEKKGIEKRVNACHVDSYLWFAGKDFKDAKSHLCRTTAY